MLSQESFYVLFIKYMFSWYIIGCLFAFQHEHTEPNCPFFFRSREEKGS